MALRLCIHSPQAAAALAMECDRAESMLAMYPPQPHEFRRFGMSFKYLRWELCQAGWSPEQT